MKSCLNEYCHNKECHGTCPTYQALKHDIPQNTSDKNIFETKVAQPELFTAKSIF
jgi:hypothetical protein